MGTPEHTGVHELCIPGVDAAAWSQELAVLGKGSDWFQATWIGDAKSHEVPVISSVVSLSSGIASLPHAPIVAAKNTDVNAGKNRLSCFI